MEVILLGIYCFIVWLVFIKFKLLPWTTPWKVGVFIFPVLALATVMLLLNIFAPTTSDVRVIKYVVPIVPGVRGRVTEVPAENNRPVKKGDVLFKVDASQYEADLNSHEADLASALARIASEQAKLNEMNARLADVQSVEPQLTEKLRNATEQIGALQASLELANKRVEQHTELTAAGAGPRFELEQAQTNVKELTAQIAAARATEAEVRQQLSGRVSGELATVAETRAQIATAQAQVRVAQAQADTTRAKIAHAKYDLTQTTVLAPGNGTMVNVMLRPGFFVGAVAMFEAMTFVDNDYQIYALFNQNELHQVKPGNEAEITLDTYPGHVIKAHVDSVIWAQSQGQLDANGNLPQTVFNPPPGQFPVKLVVAKQDEALFLAAGARGSAAIYTDHMSLIHIIRKVLIRTASYLDYIIIKHSISLH
jgi:multidrug resistance efflux pump